MLPFYYNQILTQGLLNTLSQWVSELEIISTKDSRIMGTHLKALVLLSMQLGLLSLMTKK